MAFTTDNSIRVHFKQTVLLLVNIIVSTSYNELISRDVDEELISTTNLKQHYSWYKKVLYNITLLTQRARSSIRTTVTKCWST